MTLFSNIQGTEADSLATFTGTACEIDGLLNFLISVAPFPVFQNMHGGFQKVLRLGKNRIPELVKHMTHLKKGS